MYMYEIKHPRWGSNLEHQIIAKVFKGVGNRDDYNVTTEQYTGLFGGKKTRESMEYVGKDWVVITDDNEIAKRQFRHRCGLLKIVMTPHRNGSIFVTFLDGHVVSNFSSSEMEFRIAPDDLKDNDGEPIAEVWFEGDGTRRGPFKNFVMSRIVCRFADKVQMDQYLDLTNRRMPKSVTHGGVTYSETSTGTYQSSDGSILPYLLIMYLLLSPNEQQAFVTQNPEVLSLLGDDTQNVVIGDGPSYDTGNETPDDGAKDGNKFGDTDLNESVIGGGDICDGCGGGF